MNGPDPTPGQAVDTVREFVMDVGGRQQGLVRGLVIVANPPGDFPRALEQPLRYKNAHLKRLLA
jgi:hypothetical protein